MNPILVGMLNPHTLDPKMALAPIRGAKNGATAGMKLFMLLNQRRPVSRREYLDRFDRINLCLGTWSEDHARRRAIELERTWRDRHVVLLGAAVRTAFEIPSRGPLNIYERNSNTFFMLPHPSGKTIWYNDEVNRARAADLLAQLYRTDREEF